MFINIAADGIDIYIKNQHYFIEKFAVVDSFHIKFLEIIHNISKKDLTTIFVLNWPWSFTTLRTWSLVINTLITTKTINPSVFICNKIDFYNVLVSQNILPNIWYIRIGQKKKLREYNFKDKSKRLSNINNINNPNTFSETVWENNKVEIIKYKNNKITFSYNNKKHNMDINDFPRSKTNLIKPNYMMGAI